MKTEIKQSASVASVAEDLFVELFCDAFGPEKTQYLFVQYPFVDIYGNRRFIDFALESEEMRIAIEIDGERFHNPNKISSNKYFDDLLKQNSLIFNNWKVYRWAYSQLKKQREKVKDELITFVGEMPEFRMLEDYLLKQKGKAVELKDHQQFAIDNLKKMRNNGESIALLYHATGTGKTVTAVTDAKNFGERTLFLAHTRELVTQAKNTFEHIWPEKQTGMYVAEEKDTNAYVVCASIQSVAQNLDQFKPDDFGYIIIDECHHSTANTYRKVLGYFRPKFTLGLTATPERTDGEDLLELFKNVAHKLDLKTAVEIGELTPIRCIRVKTNVDISAVRINGIKYNSQDLESKLFVPERNRIIVDTYLQYVKNKKTLVFCASVKHAEEIAGLFRENDVKCEAVSGTQKSSERARILDCYENGDINVLCACDLLNEGWDSPKTEVLFMARPTMSKTLYIQQLGRGMRKCKGKDYLMVFDFIDNANMFNMPYSIHRLLNIKNYRPGQLVLAPDKQIEHDMNLLAKGEKPEVYLDFPVDITDYELIDLFNWQDEVKNMISQLEFVRMVDVQKETVERYIREGKIKPDLEVPVGDRYSFKYFKEETVKKYASEFGWELITAANMKDKFMDIVKTMDMSYSYKPVLLKAMFEHVDENGRVRVEDIVDYFIGFYSDRKNKGLVVEKKNSIFCKEGFTRKDVERNIFANPFRRFEDMRFVRRSRDIEYVEFNRHIFRKLSKEDVEWIKEHCNNKLEEYYKRNIS
ncbi:ATP-dependent helicase [Thermanaerosceptrum fracticalcis]|uniref:ATP-dependent helicase n=1 Tax=Thermanaerosceptrum fracticalcis TaxID=1712410 RepID=A0A7G6E3Q4_THEFR|nr:DEAD/DEAH box helicase family protein [Thermanaerosceptrum fracticalcis]QNB46708.1 ATP-dependent helicase [Thermanaerosceptrum fracticalcis]